MTKAAKQEAVLDSVDGLYLSDEDVKRYWNELGSLDYLAQGLQFLNRQVETLEAQLRSKLGGTAFVFGNAPVMDGVPQGLLACIFHWYAVSACNYVRLVGWIAKGEDQRLAQDYVRYVIPSVKTWRDKIGAHFAQVKPDKTDTPADLVASVTFPIGYLNGSFWTQPFTFTITRSGETSTTRDDMRWSLTETHRNLAERYWRGAPDEENTNG